MTATPAPDSPVAPPSTFVSVLAWLGIILNGFLALMAVFQGFVMRSLLEDPTLMERLTAAYSTTPIPEVGPFVIGISRIIFAAFFTYALLGVAASIGLLHRKNWARLTTIVMLALTIAWMGLMTGLQLLSGNMTMPANPHYPNMPDMTAMMSTIRSFTLIVGVVMIATCGWLIWRLVSKPIRAEFVREDA
jgi:hypothetical protein